MNSSSECILLYVTMLPLRPIFFKTNILVSHHYFEDKVFYVIHPEIIYELFNWMFLIICNNVSTETHLILTLFTLVSNHYFVLCWVFFQITHYPKVVKSKQLKVNEDFYFPFLISVINLTISCIFKFE